MSDWHFGDDYDMWLYPPVDWIAPDCDYELPEPIEAANIEGTLLVNAEDAIEQVRRLQTENAKLRGYVQTLETANLDVTSRLQDYIGQNDPTDAFVIEVKAENAKLRELVRKVQHFEGLGCYGCPDEDKCDADTLYDLDCPMREEIKKDMHELGVDVDDAS